MLECRSIGTMWTRRVHGGMIVVCRNHQHVGVASIFAGKFYEIDGKLDVSTQQRRLEIYRQYIDEYFGMSDADVAKVVTSKDVPMTKDMEDCLWDMLVANCELALSEWEKADKEKEEALKCSESSDKSAPQQSLDSLLTES